MSQRRAKRVRPEVLWGRAAEPMFVLDPARRVIFVNSAVEQLTGVPAAQAIGLECNYHGPTDSGGAADLGASLAAPPEVFQGQPMTLASLFVRPTGERLWRHIHFFPCHDQEGRLLGVVGHVSQRGPTPAAADETHAELHTGLLRLRDELYRRFGFDRIIAVSPAMRRVLEQARLASRTAAHVIIWGEPGTGKELIARTIHRESPRRAAPFVPVECGIVPAETLERDLFGHTARQAGATNRAGLEQKVGDGTLFLKNIDKLSRDLQVRCETWLDERTARSPSESHCRIIATLETSPDFALARGDLRPEFLFALSTLIVPVPPLRDRREEVALLAQAFLERANARGDRQVAGLAPAALEVLGTYDWPGNASELEEVVEQAHAACAASLIGVEDLTPRIRGALGGAFAPPTTDAKIDLNATLIDTERRLIERAVKKVRGNKTRAAQLLSISRPRLLRRMQLLGLLDTQPNQDTLAGDDE